TAARPARHRIPSASGIIPGRRLGAGYSTGIARRIRKRNNRPVDIQFSGCIGQAHWASSGQLRRRGDLTVDSFQIELSALRSNISLTLHTFHAALIWRRRTARLGARPIPGVAGPRQPTHQLRQAAAADDPYADWAMCQLEAKLPRAKARIGELIQHLDRIHQDRPEQVDVGDNPNPHPVVLPLYIGSPLGFLGVYLLTDYDMLARRALLAHHTALMGQREMATILDNGGHQDRKSTR